MLAMLWLIYVAFCYLLRPSLKS